MGYIANSGVFSGSGFVTLAASCTDMELLVASSCLNQQTLSKTAHAGQLVTEHGTFTVVTATKNPLFVLTEQFINLCSFFYSRIPSLTLPVADAYSTPLCSESSTEKPCYTITDSSCQTLGNYKRSCPNWRVTYFPAKPVQKRCNLIAHCSPGYESMPKKRNTLEFSSEEILVLENKNGTLHILERRKKAPLLTPEEANRELNKITGAATKEDRALVIAHPQDQAELKLRKQQLQKDQKQIIGRLTPGSIITVDGEQPIVVTPHNKNSYTDRYCKSESFESLATATGGIMGFSPSPQSLTFIMETLFAHLLQRAEAYEGLDLVFLLDTTSSMSGDIEQVKANLSALLKQIKELNKNLSVRVALVEYRDNNYADDFVNRIDLDFRSDPDEVASRLSSVNVNGGGDVDEALYDAILMSASSRLSWRTDAMHAAMIITDAPPHPRTVDSHYGEVDVIEKCLQKDIHLVVYPIVTKSRTIF